MKCRYEIRKYQLVKADHIRFEGALLYRIRHRKTGHLGGYVECEENLSQEGDAWVHPHGIVMSEAQVTGNAQVFGNAVITGRARVFGEAQVFGSSRIFEEAWVRGRAQVFGHAQVGGCSRVGGNAWVCGSAKVFGLVRLGGDVQVLGFARLGDEIHLTGDARIEGPGFEKPGFEKIEALWATEELVKASAAMGLTRATKAGKVAARSDRSMRIRGV